MISSCLQNEPVTQIYCTHSQELCPKLIPILKSCVFLCMSGGFSRRWKVEGGVGMGARKAGLATGTWFPVCEPQCGRCSGALSPCSHPPPPPPCFLLPILPLLFLHLSLPLPLSLSHFSSSFQLAGIFSPNSGMFSVRLTSDKTLQTENRCRGGPERLSAGPWLLEALIGSARAAGWGAGLRFGWLR